MQKFDLSFLNVYREYGITALRVIIGVIFFVHGMQKLLMFGVEGTTGFLSSLGIPLAGVFAVILIAVEVLGGLALILGAFTRIVAVLVAITMLIALFTVHLGNGFFVSDGGYEFVLLMLVGGVTLTLTGAGALALDDVIAQRLGGNSTVQAQQA